MIGVGNNVTGCQTGRTNTIGKRPSHKIVLMKARKALPEASIQAYRIVGWKTRKSTNANAVTKRKRQVTKINMGKHNCISFITAAFCLNAFGTIAK